MAPARLSPALLVLALTQALATPAEARIADFFRRLVGRARPEARVAPAPAPGSRPKPAPDVAVEKLQPYVARDEAVTFIGQRIKRNVHDHVSYVHNRKLSYAMQRAGKRLSTLDLGRLLPEVSPRTRAAIKADLEAIERDHRPRDWFNTLDNLAREKTRTHKPTVRARGMLALKQQLEQAYGLTTGGEERAAYERDRLPRISRWLLRRHHGWPLHRLLPDQLPALPGSSDPFVQQMLERARTCGPVQKQLVYLDRQLARLAGDVNATDRLEALRGYIASYKRAWSRDWLRQRLTRFSGTPSPVSWTLKSNVTYDRSIDPAARARVEASLDEAWTIIRGLVHPEILKTLPAARVRVVTEKKRANHSGTTINIDPRASVGTILHELGHHIEDHAFKRTYFAALGLRTDRSFGEGTAKLQEMARRMALTGGAHRTYKADEVAYLGGFFDLYLGKRYEGGHTEMVSMGLEKLGRLESAKAVYAYDGNYLSTMLHLFQQPPPVRR